MQVAARPWTESDMADRYDGFGQISSVLIHWVHFPRWFTIDLKSIVQLRWRGTISILLYESPVVDHEQWGQLASNKVYAWNRERDTKLYRVGCILYRNSLVRCALIAGNRRRLLKYSST